MAIPRRVNAHLRRRRKKKITLSVIPRGEIKGHRRVHMFVPDERNRTFFFLESASISPVQRTGYELRHRVRHNYPDRADRFPKNQKKSQESRVQSSPSCTVIMRLELGRTLTHHWKVAFMLLTFLFFSSQVHGAFITAAHIRTIIQWQTG